MCDKLVHGSPVRWNNCVALACIGVFLFYPCIEFLNVSRRIITILHLSHYRRVCVLSYYYSQWIFFVKYLYILYKCNPLRVINSYFSHLWWSHIIILFQPLDLNESSYLGLPQPTKISYLFTWFYIAIWTIFMTELAIKC